LNLPDNGLNPSLSRQRPLKVLMLPLGWLAAHVTRLVEIGEQLRARGHQVVFAGADPEHPRSRLDFARARGFELLRAKEPDHPYVWDRFAQYGWMLTAIDLIRLHRWAPLDKILENHLQLIEREKPDLIIGDGSITVSTAGYITETPCMGVMNAYATKFFSATSPFRPMIQAWNALYLERFRRPIYKRYGVQPRNAIDLITDMPMLSPDLADFSPPPEWWPKYYTIGPILTETPCAEPDWFDELDDGRPNIYITMGTTGLLDYFLRRVYSAFGKAPYRFVVTTGGQVTSQTIAMAPDNFRFSKYAPGLRLMRKCKALIYHGGNGSMYQALACGVPVIALPSHLEQDLAAQVGVRHGFGKRVRLRGITGRKLLQDVEDLLADATYREAAQSFSSAVQNGGGAALGADIAEQIGYTGEAPPREVMKRLSWDPSRAGAFRRELLEERVSLPQRQEPARR